MSHLISNGRYPWFNINGTPKEPYIIGIAGGSASGKTSVSNAIIQTLNVPWVVLTCMDSFYKVLTPEQKDAAYRNEYDFDHPNAFDYDSLYDCLLSLKKGIKCDIPIYDFSTHSRSEKSKTIYGANVVIFEGIFALYDNRIRELMDLKLFVDSDDDIRLSRRLIRDINERGRDVHGILEQYSRFVKPSFDSFIYPTMRFADVIIPRGLDNTAALALITKHVFRQLNDRGLNLKSEISDVDWKSRPLPDNVIILEQSNHLLSILTIIRSKETKREVFVENADVLANILLEKATTLLEYTPVVINTPMDVEFNGLECNQSICGVSVIRSGSVMEKSLRKVFPDIPLGKILIQTDPTIGVPQLHYCKFPKDIHKRFVFLFDAQVVTGAAALMAIRVLLDHNVPQENIVFCAFVSSKLGIHIIHNAFPNVKTVFCYLNDNLNHNSRSDEEFSDFGNRYFGTG